MVEDIVQELSGCASVSGLLGAVALEDWGNKHFTTDNEFVIGVLSIKPNSTIRVSRGARLKIVCRKFSALGKVFFDGRGENGTAGSTPEQIQPLWRTGLHHGDQGRRHREWGEYLAAMYSHPDLVGHDAIAGTDGTDGSHIEIYYRELGDESSGTIEHDVSGGIGGAAAAGGRGRVVHCGYVGPHDRFPSDHSFEAAAGKAWPGGLSGRNGSFLFKRISD